MKKRIFLCAAMAVFFMAGCSVESQLVGEVNMISTRNYDQSAQYQRLTTYSGASKGQMRKSRSQSIGDAVNQTVKEVPGGEYIMNAKIYAVRNTKAKKGDPLFYYVVEGDVWGIPMAGVNYQDGGYQGFSLGDIVGWNFGGRMKKGKIIALKDSEKCVVEDEKGHNNTIAYDKLMRLQNTDIEHNAWRKEDSTYINKFNVGDSAIWQSYNRYIDVKIIAIKDAKSCIVQDGKERKYTVKFDKLIQMRKENE